MKEAIGGSWLFMIVIVMVALFTSYISISTNYSRCYHIKDEIINAIEVNGGVDGDALSTINTYLNDIGYRSFSSCRNLSTLALDGTIKAFRVDDSTTFHPSGQGNYCIEKHNIKAENALTGHLDMSYYTVTVFFQLSMPVIGQLFVVPVSGETSPLPDLEDANISWG